MSAGNDTYRQSVGKRGEQIASEYLVRHGYKILDRNFKARYGELDIIALDKNILVFVEVKTRINESFGTPAEAVTPRKLREVIQTAQYYKILHPEFPDAIRIDVIGILLDLDTMSTKSLEHIPNVTG